MINSKSKAISNYEKAHYSKLTVRIKKEDLILLKSAADRAGLPVSRFILNCVEKQTGLDIALSDGIAATAAAQEARQARRKEDKQ